MKDKYLGRNITMIQYHLFEHPLYESTEGDCDTLNVLVVGFSNYGQEFLDICLQVGQMRNIVLNVTVLLDSVHEKETYLNKRPELRNFYNVDGSLPNPSASYGYVTFEANTLTIEEPCAKASALQDFLCDYYEAQTPNYVFVALGEDALCVMASNACLAAADLYEKRCNVSCVIENEAEFEENTKYSPVFVNADVRELPLFPEIERMAFNSHLVWEKNLNLDYSAVRADFMKEYNYASCIASALSLKYKLHSVGINLDEMSYSEAAKQFVAVISGKKHRSFKNELVWMEHRRWVTEKICLGWTSIKNVNECSNGLTKDEKNKRHICIRNSRPDQKLATDYRANGNYEKWDTASAQELSLLDELDRMSVELHRVYVSKATQAKENNILSGNNITAIRRLIDVDKSSVRAFQEWYSCLKDILNGDQNKVRLYKALKNAFLKSTHNLQDERRKAVRDQVSSFDSLFFPVIASMEYRDWKQDDVAFVENIPFILTYSEHSYVAIPFQTESLSKKFENLAAPMIISPERILYLYLVHRQNDLDELRESIPYVIEFMSKKRMKAAVEFIIAYTPAAKYLVDDSTSLNLRSLGKGKIRQVKFIEVAGMPEVPTAFEQYLKRRCEKKTCFALEVNESTLSYMFQVAGIYSSFANYRFDSSSMKFHSISGCEQFSYIRKSPFITVNDIAAFKLSSSESSNQPEFYADYKELWRKYSERSGIWKHLCEVLSEHSERNDIIATFQKKKTYGTDLNTGMRFILPFVCGKCASQVIDFLKKNGVIGEDSQVCGYTSDSCEIIIRDVAKENEPQFNKLFSNVYALMIPEAVSCHVNTRTHEAIVKFDNLVVSGIMLPANKSYELTELLLYFKEMNYISNFSKSLDNKIGFTYATRSIKELLTTAGKMLEVYVYHKAKELGKFDDIVSSFEIDWANTEIKNEFDCIMTKGFRTLFVECKARPNIDQSFYFKLSSLAEQFGINATAVLIADTQERSYYDNANVNAMQRKRGKMMDVITIWKPNDISNIGHTLLNIINGTYIIEEE